MKHLILLVLVVRLCATINAQNDSRHLIPHLTSEQRVSMHQPPNGLLVFDTGSESFWYFQAGYWMDLNSGKTGNPKAYPLRSLPSTTEEVKVIVEGRERVVIDSTHMSVIFPDSSTVIGYEAGNENAIITDPILDDQGKYNTFVGLQAGFKNNVDPGLCDQYAFFNIYEGGCSANNTFLGTRAGFSNTLGRNNVFIGSRAGFSNLGNDGFFSPGEGGTGVENTFVGFLSGHFNQNGFWNTFLGAYSGEENGRGTLSDNVGRYNTYIGTSAGRFNRFGVENVYVGTEAGGGFENDAGERNVYMGYRSGRLNQGNDNVYVGHLAGPGDLFNTSTSNVCIGSSAGGFTSGSRNVFIGHRAGFETPDGDDRLIIGNSVNDLITGRFDAPSVQINGRLHVSDTVSIMEDLVLSGDRIDRTGNLTVESSGTLTIVSGQHEIILDPNGNITIQSNANVNISSDQDINLSAGDDIILDAGGDILTTSGGRTDITGNTELELNSNSTMDINSTGTLDLDGNGLVLLTAATRLDLVGTSELELNSSMTIDMNGTSFDFDALDNIEIDGNLIDLNGSNGSSPAARVSSAVTIPPCTLGCTGFINNGSSSVRIGN